MPDRPPTVIGVTGNIACGKSLVSSILGEAGAEVIDADRVAHEIMAPGGVVIDEIAERFGDHVINDDGSINRAALGGIVFSDPEALQALEAITHPPTVREILKRAHESNAEIVVIDAIKLFEAGLADHCAQTWAVVCEESAQLQRLMKRNGIDEAEALRRIRAQPPQEEKRARADVVIDNSGEIEETRQQVIFAIQRLRRETGTRGNVSPCGCVKH
jgi:dephospho-CoA kinase